MVLDVVGSNPTSRPKHPVASSGDQPAEQQKLQPLHFVRNRSHHELVQRIGDFEKRLSQAFRTFAEINIKRITQDGDTAVLISRVTTLEDRVLRLEMRLNMPPQ